MAQPPRPQQFRSDRPIVDSEGRPTIEFLNNLNAARALTIFLADLQAATAQANAAAATAQAAAVTAQGAAENAQNAADAAQTDGGITAAEQSIQASFPEGFAAPLISSDSLGNVIVANHSRRYGNPTLNPTVAVTGNTLSSGFAAGDIVRVYYDDPARAGGAVTYMTTLDATVAVQTGSRHSVGAVEIPAVGNQDGRELTPPGYVNL